ncbi:MAG TPA: glycoside hydrolase family 2 TIM barrel-domain containing protein [Bacteroidales bacterium]|nr:glycoside hydrolase family 2 TIM barrel-domain containing protein [Bacteroidales bacterium]
MNNINLRAFLFFVISVTIASCTSSSDNIYRITENFGSGWKFSRKATGDTTFTDWETINLPNTMRIESLVVNDQFQGLGHYIKTFSVSEINDKKFFLYFEGVMQMATVYINGEKVLTHSGGYLPFTVDATPFLCADSTNQIEVWVDNTDNPQVPPGKALADLDFNNFGGIYRNVHLITTGKIFITDAVEANEAAGGGVLVDFDEVNAELAQGILRVQAKNESGSGENLRLLTTLISPDGQIFHFRSDKKHVKPDSTITLQQELVVDDPLLWSPQQPHLYRLLLELMAGERLLDSISLNIGIRKIELTENGFFVNGEKQFLRGTNRHQEYPYVGYALSDEAQWRDAVKIKSAGFDFVRLSHYPHAEAFMNACDALGLLVMDCIPGWQYFGGSVFVENSFQNCRDMIRRDRNHACVAFWELSLNESWMTDEYMQTVNEILNEELPFGDSYSAGWMDHPAYDLFIPARQHAEPPDYWNFYKNGSRKVFVAEYGDWEYYAKNAGFNQKAFGDLKADERTSRQLRGNGEKCLLQQALNFSEATASNRRGVGTIGHANWLMFDYNRGYADDLEASGIADIFRIPKFAWYFYQSQRPPQEQYPLHVASGPMVFIASYNTRQSLPNITVYSNCQEVELIFGDSLIARQSAIKDSVFASLRFPPYYFANVPVGTAKLTAIGYIDGKEATRHKVDIAGAPARIMLQADLEGISINTDHQDIFIVNAFITDSIGNTVYDSDVEVRFAIEGSGAIIGQNPVQAQAGIASALLRTETLDAPLVIRATAPGLMTGNLVIKKTASQKGKR